MKRYARIKITKKYTQSNIFFKLKKKGRKTPTRHKLENVPDYMIPHYRQEVKKKGGYDFGVVKLKKKGEIKL